MVPRPQESRERHSGNIPNTSLLKALEGCVQFRLFTSSVWGEPSCTVFTVHLFPVFFLSKQLSQVGAARTVVGEKLNQSWIMQHLRYFSKFPIFPTVQFLQNHFMTDLFDKHSMWTIKNKNLCLLQITRVVMLVLSVLQRRKKNFFYQLRKLQLR